MAKISVALNSTETATGNLTTRPSAQTILPLA